MNNYSMITNIAYLNSNIRTINEIKKLFHEGLFNDNLKWDDFKLSNELTGLMDAINSRKKYYMSKLSLAVYNIMENGPGKNIQKEDEIYLFSGFTEIETISKIGNMFVEDNYSINPAIFPNSVHHISLCYYTILKNITNYCAAVTDGLNTNSSFINFIKYRSKLKSNFIIIAGEENSQFFNNEIKNVLNIVPSYVSYKIVPGSDRGFEYKGEYPSLDDLTNSDFFKDSKNVFADKMTFFELKNKNIKVFSEYPIVKDNPCGIAFRLALPFCLELKGSISVIDKTDDKYHLFEVMI